MVQTTGPLPVGSTSGSSDNSAPVVEGGWSVQSVLSTLPQQPRIDSNSPVPFFHILERLKTTKREGWRRFGISNGESISDHMYRMSLITMLAPSSIASKIDIAHCTKMALVHDMAESLVGDITPIEGVAKVEKARREGATMDYICTSLLGKVDSGLAGKEMRAIWQEYEDGETLESKYVHDIDKMELILQMVEYERSHDGKLDLSEFSWVAKRIQLPEVKTWCDEVLQEREEYWRSIGKTPRRLDISEEQKAQQDVYYGNGAAPSGR